MNELGWRPLTLIVVAALFSVGGDWYLKEWADHRRWISLALCLGLWECCALLWVAAYYFKLPLGRPTAIGLLLSLSLNCGVGVAVHNEALSRGQWLGLGLGVASVLLLVVA